MTDKLDQGLQDDLRQSLESAFGDEVEKKLKKKVDDISGWLEDELLWRVKDDLARHLVGHVAEMATRAVEQMLAGNEDQMRRYLSCEKRDGEGNWMQPFTGRSTGYTGPNPDIARQHPVIHGVLFEQGAIALRKKVVDVHREFLVNERILDLEDQVKSLVAQNNKLEAEKEQLYARVRAA